MAELFKQLYRIGWGDMDMNGHMRNAAYLDAASNVRMMFFKSQNITAQDFARLGVGPIALKDVLEYRRELFMLEEVMIALEAAGLSEDGSRFRLRNSFFRQDGKLAATLTTDGAWLDLQERRITRPPQEIFMAIQVLTRTVDFTELAPGVLA